MFFTSLSWLLWSINKLKQGLWCTIWLNINICLYIYIYIYILIKKISVMHSLTNTLMSGVCKPRFPKLGRLVGERQFGHDVSELSHMAMLVMWKLTFCRKLSITSPSYQIRKMKKGGCWFSTCKTFFSNLLKRNYILHIQRNFRFLI